MTANVIRQRASVRPDRADAHGPSTDLVRVYLDEIGRIPLLTAEGEVELARRIEAGVYAAELLRRHGTGEAVIDSEDRRRLLAAVVDDGARAKSHMLEANLRLVVSVARKYSHRGMPFGDVVQEGNLGLVRAVEKFDYQKGFKFSTYATWWIRQAITRGLAEQSRMVRLPVHVHEEVGKLARIERDLLAQLDRQPTDEEIAAAAGMELERVVELRRVSRDVLSLDSPVGDDGDTSLGDLVVEDGGYDVTDAVGAQARNDDVRNAVAALPDREAAVLRLRFGLSDGRSRTLEEVGRELGLSRERVRHIEKQALGRLRAAAESDDEQPGDRSRLSLAS